MEKELVKRDDVSEEKPLQLNSSSDGQDEDFRLGTDESVEIKSEGQNNIDECADEDEKPVYAESENKRDNIKKAVIDCMKRSACLLIGLFIMAFGVSFSIKALLGTSPVSSIPNVVSIVSGLSVGTTTIIVTPL